METFAHYRPVDAPLLRRQLSDARELAATLRAEAPVDGKLRSRNRAGEQKRNDWEIACLVRRLRELEQERVDVVAAPKRRRRVQRRQ